MMAVQECNSSQMQLLEKKCGFFKELARATKILSCTLWILRSTERATLSSLSGGETGGNMRLRLDT